MCLKSTEEIIHCENYSIKTLNRKNMLASFYWMNNREICSGQCKDDGLGNVPSTSLSYFIFLLFNYGSLRYRTLFYPQKTKKGRLLLILISGKLAGFSESSRGGQWLLIKEK